MAVFVIPEFEGTRLIPAIAAVDPDAPPADIQVHEAHDVVQP